MEHIDISGMLNIKPGSYGEVKKLIKQLGELKVQDGYIYSKFVTNKNGVISIEFDAEAVISESIKFRDIFKSLEKYLTADSSITKVSHDDEAMEAYSWNWDEILFCSCNKYDRHISSNEIAFNVSI